MNLKQITFLKSVLGSDIMDVLAKSELYKPGTKTTVDPNEIRVALQIVPRTILSWLICHLKPMQIGDSKELDLPFAEGKLHVNKHGADVYSGEVYDKNSKVLYEFKYRSLPSVGLVLLTTFELYEDPTPEVIAIAPQAPVQETDSKLQDLIDQRLKLHDIIRGVVDQRITEREALQQMLLMKLKESFAQPAEDAMVDKKLKLREFLDGRNKKDEEVEKSEDLKCIQCTSLLYKSGDKHIKCCVCYGEFHNAEIKFEKKEGKVSLKFPKSFDQENIEMLLESLKSKKK